MFPFNKRIPVIDLFAGPGGLGEGFSAFSPTSGHSPFEIALSVEKDRDAHQTLLLRSFFRQFRKNDRRAPDNYYSFLRGEISRPELFSRHPEEAHKAEQEAVLAELGSEGFSQKQLDNLVNKALGKNDCWVLIGGPPCQAFSTAGRSRNHGIKDYVPENDPRHFLYREYLGIIARHWPPVFVMENVKGILSAKVNGGRIFDHIVSDLRAPAEAAPHHRALNGKTFTYSLFSLVTGKASLGENQDNPEDYIIQSENYGIPQTRHRVIILGVREDLLLEGIAPPKLTLGKGPISVADVISDLPRLRSGLSQNDSGELWKSTLVNSINTEWYEELEDMKIRDEITSAIAGIQSKMKTHKYVLQRGQSYISREVKQKGPKELGEWFQDDLIKGVCNHEAKSHREDDLHRYLFAACFAKANQRSPKLCDFPQSLLPNHRNVKLALKSGSHFADRFRVQVKNSPSKTVTCHIAKDGHYYIHYDPEQCRSLTVRESARLQTFPDNYFFCGSRTAQYTQVGNAVPPLLACQIAEVVYRLLEQTE